MSIDVHVGSSVVVDSFVFITDPTYADTLLTHARQLYDFGYNYQKTYTDSISNAIGFYKYVPYTTDTR